MNQFDSEMNSDNVVHQPEDDYDDHDWNSNHFMERQGWGSQSTDFSKSGKDNDIRFIDNKKIRVLDKFIFELACSNIAFENTDAIVHQTNQFLKVDSRL